MELAVKTETRHYLKDWFRRHRTDELVAITLTGKNYFGKQSIDLIDAEENLRHFTNYLDRRLGTGSRTKKILPKAFVMEVKNDRPHAHGVMVMPKGYSFSWLLENIINQCWNKTRYGWDQVQVDTEYDILENAKSEVDSGWISYMTKFENPEDFVCWQSTQF